VVPEMIVATCHGCGGWNGIGNAAGSDAGLAWRTGRALGDAGLRRIASMTTIFKVQHRPDYRSRQRMMRSRSKGLSIMRDLRMCSFPKKS
jgi:hypothetical protein